jgi:glyoxylase-like metal-dependent hydrolase (beta-lactamase superfamily II)
MDAADLLAPASTGGVQRIAREVWRIVAPNPGPLTGPGTNTYVIGEQRSTVVDPGPTDSAHLDRILDVTGGKVDRILCTHSHPDHSPGAAPLRERTGALVYGLPAPDDGYQDDSYSPDRGYRDGERIDAGASHLAVLHTPGHASNHVCLLLEELSLLFTGDHLMSGSTVVILPPDGSMRQYLESLRRLRELPISDLAPGHGAVIRGAREEIDRVLAHRGKREAKVIEALRSRGTTTLDAILAEVYSDVPVSLHPVAMQSLLAHAIKLEEEGRALRAGESWAWLCE